MQGCFVHCRKMSGGHHPGRQNNQAEEARLLLKPGCLLSPVVRLVTALNKIEILEVQLFHEDLNLLFKAMMQGETSVTSLSSLWGHLYLSELDPESFFWRV